LGKPPLVRNLPRDARLAKRQPIRERRSVSRLFARFQIWAVDADAGLTLLL